MHQAIFLSASYYYFCGMKILMVCLGNICRSPLAEALVRKKAEESGLSLLVDSAGTASYHIGNPPDPRTVANAKKHHLDLSNLKARQFATTDFDNFDRIYAMDEDNRNMILKLAANEPSKVKVKLLLEHHPHVDFANVPDPYYGDESAFEEVYQLLDETTDYLIESLRNEK